MFFSWLSPRSADAKLQERPHSSPIIGSASIGSKINKGSINLVCRNNGIVEGITILKYVKHIHIPHSQGSIEVQFAHSRTKTAGIIDPKSDIQLADHRIAFFRIIGIKAPIPGCSTVGSEFL